MSVSVALFVMTRKGYLVLELLAKEYRDLISLVVIGQDSALTDDFSDQIRATCEKYSIPHYNRSDDVDIRTTHVLAISWRWMIHAPDSAVLVLHDSLLPKYRGFAPMVNALINGEPEIGVTALFGSGEYDRGDIIATSSVKISYPLTIRDAIELNLQNYLAVVQKVFDYLRDGLELPRIPQNDSEASYSIWRDAADFRIDWSESSERICRHIDAVGPPYAGAVSYIGTKKVIIWSAVVVEDVPCELRHVGKVIFVRDDYPVVICGRGLLKITSGTVVSPTGDMEDLLPLKSFRTRFE